MNPKTIKEILDDHFENIDDEFVSDIEDEKLEEERDNDIEDSKIIKH
jgi:hypothetical protein